VKVLTPPAVERYRRDGFYFPIRVLAPGEALERRRRLEAVEAAHGGRLGGELRQKPHLLFTWLADLVRHPAILDAVEDVLGPNLLVWSTSFFIKEARDPAYVSWHQDATYWGLSEPDVVTAWLAFTEATVENGAMRMVPGSHGEQLAHHDTFAPNNLLYFKFSHGVKSGGFNTAATLPVALIAVAPEKLDAYEAGYKSQWFNHRLTFDATNELVFTEDEKRWQTLVKEITLGQWIDPRRIPEDPTVN